MHAIVQECLKSLPAPHSLTHPLRYTHLSPPTHHHHHLNTSHCLPQTNTSTHTSTHTHTTRVENEDREPDPTLLNALESFAPPAVGTNWGAAVDVELITNLGRYRRYDYTCLRDLLRVVRNKRNHFREMPDSLQQLMGPLPNGFYRCGRVDGSSSSSSRGTPLRCFVAVIGAVSEQSRLVSGSRVSCE